jgi:uncharacterized LabA/DUF88 family protein
MSDSVTPPTVVAPAVQRIRVFVDYWNFQLSLNQTEAKARGISLEEARFQVDWKRLGQWLAAKAAAVVGLGQGAYSFDGAIIYSSFNPQTEEGRRFRAWATTWLDRQPGVTVECRERKRKRPPRCPACHRPIDTCPLCQKPMVATEEKGVDTLIATDMIRLAWETAYDVGVLATSDSDLVPAVQFLSLKGRKVVQAGFPPLGVELATACWASFDVAAEREALRRPPKPPGP